MLWQDTHLVPREAAVRGVAGAAAVQGRLLHLREARQGPAQEVPRQAPPHGRRRRRRPEGAPSKGR